MSQQDQSSSDPATKTLGQAPKLLVGVGASAGGLKAFSQMLEAMPADTGMAFLLVQHLSPTHKSIMPELLQRHTSMPVLEAADGLQVLANHVYMVPPNCIMSISEGQLRLCKPIISRHGQQLPIDEFLVSLADDASERAAGVILSGTGSDGSAGIKAIKEAGGLVLVEDPATASYSGMPKSAAATGLADYVLPISGLADKLVLFSRQPHLLRLKEKESVYGLGEKALKAIIETLHLRTGYDFREYKKPTLSRRIQRRMGLRNESDPQAYIELLNKDDYESLQLFKDMLIGVTTFFRDREAFADLRKHVLAPLVRRHGGKRPVRVWVAGCSTGEEAYTVAILLSEEFAKRKLEFNAQIFATDIDEDAVSRARAGRYSANVANELPEKYLRNYFEEDEGGYVVKKALRESVTFAVQNLTADPPFSKLDLICCRNLLIYLEATMQNKLLQLFHFALNKDGYIFLGSSESATRHENLFSSVSQQSRIFQRITVTRQSLQRLTEQRFYSFNKNAPHLVKGTVSTPLGSAMFSAAETTRNLLLSHYAPPSVLINSNYEILYFQGETSRYLYRLEGEPTNDLCAIAANGLRTKIRAAVQKARKEEAGASARARQVIRHDGATVSVVVTALPVKKDGSENPLFLVTFKEPETELNPPSELTVEEKDIELSSQLEYELYATRQDLQSTIEQLETSNEELKASNEEIMSMNEELQSSNEELETSREELQSLNEELNTVNSQLEEKVHELELVNNDLSNLLSSTDIATIFLDVNLRIRRFTPASHKIIRLIDGDIGRPLADLALNFRDKDLISDARQVLDSLQPSEKQVVDEQGQVYLRRITLYRTTSNRIEGVVLTFTDVTEITRTLRRLQSREKQQALISQFGQEALTRPDLDSLFETAVQLTSEALGTELCKILERREDKLFLRAGVGWREGLVGNSSLPADAGSQGGYTLISKTPVVVEDLKRETRFNGPQLLIEHQVTSGISVAIGPYTDAWGVLGIHTREHQQFSQEDVNFVQAMANVLWAAIQHDITLNEVRSQTMQLQLAMRLGRMGSWRWDLEQHTALWDEALFEIMGLPPRDDAIPGEVFFERIHPDDQEQVRAAFAQAQTEGSSFAEEFRIIQSGSNRVRWLVSCGGVQKDHGSQHLIMYGISYDVTERKNYEVALHDREEWLRLAFSAAELSSFWIDFESDQVTHFNPNQAGEFGGGAHSMSIGEYLQCVSPEDRALVRQHWQLCLDTCGNFVVEYRVRAGAEVRWLRHWGQCVDLQGHTRIAGITMDVSDEKETQARLQTAKDAADISNEAKSTFLANMSHEIRTPLTAILGYADLLQLESAAPGRSANYLQRIKTNGQNLLEIINDVLDLSKVEADKIEIQIRELPIKSLLAELLSMMHLRAKDKGLEFRIDVRGPVPPLLNTDPGRLKQVLANLISNAIKFTEHGSIRLLVSIVDSKPDNTFLEFRVVDTGIGIEAEALQRIFEPFEQVDSSLAKHYGGTGLGLTISKRISELLGGKLSVESTVDEGSTFTLRLPVGASDSADHIVIEGVEELVQEAVALNIDTRQLANVHVLVVDDIEDVLVLIQQMLRRAGAKVSTAANGSEAIERISQCDDQGKPVDIVLMDTMMPVMDGYTAVKQLRLQGFSKPIIALTAAAMINDRERCLQAGCNDYLSKPVTIEKLLSVLQTQLPSKEEIKVEKVLVIEDNQDAAEAVKVLLEMAGYNCRHASTGTQGLELATNFQADIILLDLTLPDTDGFKVAATLRQQGFRGKLVALSGQDLEAQQQALRDAGFDEQLQKPVDMEALAVLFPELASLA